jgi:basic amino acid/polyamine antiporter, APA family
MTHGSGEHGGLTKALGLVRLSLYGVGTIIGAGIYSVIGPAAGAAGDGVWLSFLIAAVISAFERLSNIWGDLFARRAALYIHSPPGRPTYDLW